jgi:hypothetical protein
VLVSSSDLLLSGRIDEVPSQSSRNTRVEAFLRNAYAGVR